MQLPVVPTLRENSTGTRNRATDGRQNRKQAAPRARLVMQHMSHHAAHVSTITNRLAWRYQMRFLWLALVPLVVATSNDSSTIVSPANQTIFLAGILDTDTYDWAASVFRHTFNLLNNRTDGFHDDIDASTLLEYTLVNDDCDETTAVRAYWNASRPNPTDTSATRPLHGIVGSRCSGASVAMARLAGLEGVPQVSPVSTTAQLSDDEEFPYFSRLVAPDTSEGEVGALLALLHKFGWKRVSLLATDTQYAQDMAAEFRKLTGDATLWKGEVAYANAIELLPDSNQVNPASVRQVLQDMPTSDPTVNSRIVVLLAQEEHAFDILKLAHDMNFQKDTVWVGVSSWIGHDSTISTDWLPDYPGYLGLGLYRNRNPYARQYLDLVLAAAHAEHDTVWNGTDFPHDVIPYVVDSIVALVRALSLVSEDQRTNGTAVTQALRGLQWEGVSGPVTFSPNGDRANPQYTIFNYQKRSADSLYQWVEVGSTGTDLDSAQLTNGFRDVCFAHVGCNVSEVPSDQYPVPKELVAVWALVVIPLISVLVIVLAIKNRRHKSTLNELQKKLANLDDEVDDAIEKRNKLILARGALIDKPDTWSSTDTKTLVEVDPSDDQYWAVTRQLQDTMPDAHIAKLWRVQNTALWSYYSFHKHRLALNGIDTNELDVWHGTSKVDPNVIYNDTQDGFMMQYSNDGFWGRGIYFAKKSEYSHSYAFQPSNRPHSSISTDGRPVAKGDEREIFLTKLLAGNAVELNRDASAQKAAECRALTVPPVHPNGVKYNTVTGHTGGSQVWIVYENGRAYPEYLVRYYRGPRDSRRTPWASQGQSSCTQPQLPEEAASVDMDLEAANGNTTDVVWEFGDTSGWKAYSVLHQSLLEQAYQKQLGPQGPATTNVFVSLKSDDWVYQVDLVAMVQTNVEHSNRTQRKVQRRVLNIDAAA